MRPWGPPLALAAGCAIGNACLIELDHVLACGDGYIDVLANEECDPNDPQESHLAACPNNRGGCDPDTCEIINTELQCAKCGDGVISTIAGEECDGSNIGVPCWGDGSPTCTSECKLDFDSCAPCGNGIVEDGEECDNAGTGGGIAIPRPCAGSIEFEPLQSPYGDFPYTSGSTAACLPNCTYDRTSCGYCNNGRVEGPLIVALPSTVSLAEICDGEAFDAEVLADEYPLCDEIGAQANVACSENCRDLIERGGQACCLPKNSRCPAEGDSLRCCYEYAHPEAEDFCLPVLVPSGGEGGGDGEGNAVVCR